MALILLAVTEKVAVQLADVVLAERDRLVRLRDEIHNLRVARNLLLVARLEPADAGPAENRFDLLIGERAALDARGRADALDGGDVSERIQPLGRKPARGPPRPSKRLDARQEAQHAGGEGRRVGWEQFHINIQI